MGSSSRKRLGRYLGIQQTCLCTMAKVVINKQVYTIHSEESHTFRCGKTVTVVELRKEDTEITVTTAGNWKQLLDIKPEREDYENQNL